MNDFIPILSFIYFILAGFIVFNECLKIRNKIGIPMKEDIPWNKQFRLQKLLCKLRKFIIYIIQGDFDYIIERLKR